VLRLPLRRSATSQGCRRIRSFVNLRNLRNLRIEPLRIEPLRIHSVKSPGGFWGMIPP
jgi:hypothetical protein